MEVQDVTCSAHGRRSHSFKGADDTGILKLNVGGESTDPDLAGPAHDQFQSGRPDALSLKGIFDDKSQIAARRSSHMQFCESDRFTVPSDDQRILVVRVCKNVLQVPEGCRW
jgi:hypothetical protein